MKKTRILSAVALASLMAACSNEEIAVLENNAQKQDLSIRPLVENTTILDGVESRMAVTGAYRPQFADGDKLGAVLIDEPTYANREVYATAKENGSVAEDLYHIVEKMYSNYPYERVEGAWYTQAALVEGNYMFYAPFNEENSFVRSNPVVRLPKEQTVSSKTSAIEEFAASGEIVKVGYAFMDAEGSMKPVVAMQDVFAYPLITLKNNFKGYLFDDRAGLAAGQGVPTLYEGDIKVDSIQIIHTSPVVVEASLDYSDQTSAVASNATEGLVFRLRDTDGANTNPWYVDWTEAYTSQILGTANEVKRDVLTTLVLGKTLAKGAVETFNVVLPAMNYGTDLGARVFVTIGGKQYQINGGVMLTENGWTAAEPKLSYSGVVDNSVDFTSVATTGVTLIKAQQYPAEVYNTNGTVKEGADELMTIDLVGGVVEGYATAESASDITPNTEAIQAAFEWDPETPSAVGIKNNTELINWFKNTVKNTILTEVQTPADKTQFNLLQENEVVINAELIDALAEYNGDQGAIEFTSLLPIADDVIMTAAAVNGNEAEVTFQSLASENEFTVTIPVTTATASITVDGNYVLDTTPVTSVNSSDPESPLTNVNFIVPSTVNNASIDLTTITDAGFISAIYNMGTLTINSDMDGSALNVFNVNTLTLAVGKKTNAKIYNAGTFNNNGLMMVAGTNNNAVVAGNASTTKIAAGTGSVNNTVLATVAVTGGTQTVYYNHTAATDWTAQNTTALATTGINKIVVDGDLVPANAVALTKPFKNCTVTEIEFNGTTVTTDFESADLTGMTIKFTATSAITWNGAAAGTTLTKCTFVSDQNITLNNVTATGSIASITAGTDVEVVIGEWASWN